MAFIGFPLMKVFVNLFSIASCFSLFSLLRILTFLSNFSAHRSFQSWQMFFLSFCEAICDGEGGVVKWIRTFGVSITSAFPAFDSVT